MRCNHIRLLIVFLLSFVTGMTVSAQPVLTINCNNYTNENANLRIQVTSPSKKIHPWVQSNLKKKEITCNLDEKGTYVIDIIFRNGNNGDLFLLTSRRFDITGDELSVDADVSINYRSLVIYCSSQAYHGPCYGILKIRKTYPEATRSKVLCADNVSERSDMWDIDISSVFVD